MQKTRQTKQPDSNLEISFLHSLHYLQVTKQSQISSCDTTPYKKLDVSHLLRKTIFFPLYKKVTEFACLMQSCVEGFVIPSVSMETMGNCW